MRCIALLLLASAVGCASQSDQEGTLNDTGVPAAQTPASLTAGMKRDSVSCTAPRRTFMNQPVTNNRFIPPASEREYVRVRVRNDVPSGTTMSITPHPTKHGVSIDLNPTPSSGTQIEISLDRSQACGQLTGDIYFMYGQGRERKGANDGRWVKATFRWSEIELPPEENPSAAILRPSGFVILSN